MSICVEVDTGGFIVSTVEVYPQCAELALVEPSHLERLTYWADLAILFDPCLGNFCLCCL